MPEQPQTMEELLGSVARAASESMTLVIPTMYHRAPEELSTSHREVARAALRQHSYIGNNIDGMRPGEEYRINGQTDMWYARHDTEGLAIFANLTSIVLNAARERR